MTTLQEKAAYSAAKYLCKRGYSLLEHDWSTDAGSVDLIAKDNNDESVVFVAVVSSEDAKAGFTEKEITKEHRTQMEMIAAKYLADYEKTDIKVRFDVISVLAISKDKALLRHHVNILGAAQ